MTAFITPERLYHFCHYVPVCQMQKFSYLRYCNFSLSTTAQEILLNYLQLLLLLNYFLIYTLKYNFSVHGLNPALYLL